MNIHRLPDAYMDGIRARSAGFPKVPPALSMEMRYWWLAGWNDRDLELAEMEDE